MKRACVFVLKFQFLPLFFVRQGWETWCSPTPTPHIQGELMASSVGFPA